MIRRKGYQGYRIPPEIKAQVIELAKAQELSPDDIAKTCGISEASVRTIMRDAEIKSYRRVFYCWTDEEITVLKYLANKGYTCREIAIIMRMKYSNIYTAIKKFVKQ